jgi:hypothetical protein
VILAILAIRATSMMTAVVSAKTRMISMISRTSVAGEGIETMPR